MICSFNKLNLPINQGVQKTAVFFQLGREAIGGVCKENDHLQARMLSRFILNVFLTRIFNESQWVRIT